MVGVSLGLVLVYVLSVVFVKSLFIEQVSSGFDSSTITKSSAQIDDKKYNLAIGWNFLVLDENSGIVLDQFNIDFLWLPVDDIQAIDYLNSIQENRIVLITTHDTPSNQEGTNTEDGITFLNSWGCTGVTSALPYRSAFIFRGAASVTNHPSWTYCEMQPQYGPSISQSIDISLPLEPTTSPTLNPTHPTAAPTPATISPTLNPTNNPTAAPTIHPTVNPTNNPTTAPTIHPTVNPTNNPTSNPSNDPTAAAAIHPTVNPTPTPLYAGNANKSSVVLFIFVLIIAITFISICIVIMLWAILWYRTQRQKKNPKQKLAKQPQRDRMIEKQMADIAERVGNDSDDQEQELPVTIEGDKQTTTGNEANNHDIQEQPLVRTVEGDKEVIGLQIVRRHTNSDHNNDDLWVEHQEGVDEIQDTTDCTVNDTQTNTDGLC